MATVQRLSFLLSWGHLYILFFLWCDPEAAMFKDLACKHYGLWISYKKYKLFTAALKHYAEIIYVLPVLEIYIN